MNAAYHNKLQIVTMLKRISHLQAVNEVNSCLDAWIHRIGSSYAFNRMALPWLLCPLLLLR